MDYSLAGATANLNKSMLMAGPFPHIETTIVMAYCPRTVMACYTGGNWQIRLLCGLA